MNNSVVLVTQIDDHKYPVQGNVIKYNRMSFDSEDFRGFKDWRWAINGYFTIKDNPEYKDANLVSLIGHIKDNPEYLL